MTALLKHHWYVGALSHEVGATPLERTLLGMRVRFERTAAGEVVASCGSRTYAVVEGAPLIWFWPSDRSTADAATIPAVADIGIGVDGWCVDAPEHVLVRARSGLIYDNLMDVAHIDFLHRGTIARVPHVFAPSTTVEREGQHRTVRRASEIDASDFAHLLPDIAGSVDLEQIFEFRGVGLIVGAGNRIYASARRTPGRALAEMYFAHAITPETERSTHYFPLITRNVRIDDRALSALLLARNLTVVCEDRSSVEAIERNCIGTFEPLRDLVSVAADAAALRVRRIVATLAQAESEPRRA